MLRDRGVEQAERMWESNRPIDLHAIALAHSPHGAGKIAKTIRGEKCRLLKRRNKKTARKVRSMVFDAVEFRLNRARIHVEGRGQRFGNPREFCNYSCTLARKRRHPHRIK